MLEPLPTFPDLVEIVVEIPRGSRNLGWQDRDRAREILGTDRAARERESGSASTAG